MFSLLELLRHRRQLEVPELVRLLGSLPRLLTVSGRRDIPPLLDIIRVHFVGLADPQHGRSLLSDRVEKWPPFILYLEAEPDEAGNGEGDRALSGADLAELGTFTVTRFAHLLYELLGGPNRPPDETYFPPLAELSEDGNAILNVALTNPKSPDVAEFWRQFVHINQLDTPAAETTEKMTLQIVESRASFEIGNILTLTPGDPTAAQWRFVSRSRFRLGRSAEAADFVAQFLPDNAENALRTKLLSRVHVVAEVRDEQLTLRDGNGSKASLNGSKLDGVALSAKVPTPFEDPGVLALGSEYFVSIDPVFTPDVWEIANPIGWLNFDQLAPATMGAVLVEPIGQPAPSLRTVWLLNRVGFQLNDGGQMVLDHRRNAISPAMFFYQSTCFLLANISLPEEQLCLDGAPIAPWEAVPLHTGQRLRIGGQVFKVRVE